ncbi:hypothetical protein ACFPA8_07835 [Streptomyces ovatisporus]|uniref:Uncharacterized protein n=1 Tax=Streptomyces ovatisporus TaxID=1128682 RepID=A0ABV9A4L5_9ACTN
MPEQDWTEDQKRAYAPYARMSRDELLHEVRRQKWNAEERERNYRQLQWNTQANREWYRSALSRVRALVNVQKKHVPMEDLHAALRNEDASGDPLGVLPTCPTCCRETE